MTPKFLNIDIKKSLQKLMRQLHVSLFIDRLKFLENALARKEWLKGGAIGGTQNRNTAQKNWQKPQYPIENPLNTETAFEMASYFLIYHKLHLAMLFIIITQLLSNLPHVN